MMLPLFGALFPGKAKSTPVPVFSFPFLFGGGVPHVGASVLFLGIPPLPLLRLQKKQTCGARGAGPGAPLRLQGRPGSGSGLRELPGLLPGAHLQQSGLRAAFAGSFGGSGGGWVGVGGEVLWNEGRRRCIFSRRWSWCLKA